MCECGRGSFLAEVFLEEMNKCSDGVKKEVYFFVVRF